MKDLKPIKRSKELAPLSREHHDGLQFIWKIRQGIENGTPLATISKYVSWFWHNHIRPHFHDEENVLLQHLPADNPLVQQMVDEHAQIRDLIISIDQEAQASTINELADFLYKHIRFEERQLFAYAEKELSPDQLNSIFNQLSEEHGCDTEWKEEFWLRK